MIYFIIVLSLQVIIFHFYVNLIYGKRKTEINVINKIKNVIKINNIDVLVDITNNSPYYDAEKKIIYLKEGSDVHHVAAGFHELGHVYDDLEKNYEDSYSMISYYAMKYSILGAILMTYPIIIYPIWWLYLIGLAFSLTSIYFFTAVLKEELGATKHAKILMKSHVNLDKKTVRAVYNCLYSALSTYIAILVMALLIFINFLVSFVFSYFPYFLAIFN